MSDLIQPTLEEIIYNLAEVEADPPQCPQAAALAYEAIHKGREFQIYTLSEIAKLDEPYAAQVAGNWLTNNYQS
jgi:hypothetical protein